MLHFQFAYRYLKAKKSANAINIISWVSVVAIALGTASLVIVLSVFNGFEDMVKQLYGTFYADVRVVPVTGKFFELNNEQFKKISNLKGVRRVSAVIEDRAILQNGPEQSIISLKGVEENYADLNNIQSSIFKGKFDVGSPDKPSLVMGAGVELSLKLDAEKAIVPVTVYLSKQNNSTTISQSDLVTENLLPSGTFAIQDEFNNKYAFTNIAFMQTYLGLPAHTYSSMEVALDNNAEAGNIKEQLQIMLGNGYKVQTRYEQNKVLYAAMQLEKWFIYAVLALIMIVFSFTIISSLSMLVIEKQKDISVLKAMGGDNHFIRNIFMGEGFLLSGIGACSGMILALLLCFLQIKYKFIKLAGTSFLIDYYPVKVLPLDIIVIVLTVCFITSLASWLPAVKASSRPVELRSID